MRQPDRTVRRRALVGRLLVSGALASFLGVTHTSSASAAPCPQTGTDSALCTFTCSAGNGIAITITNHTNADPVSGAAECGGVALGCVTNINEQSKTCVSNTTAGRNDTFGLCEANMLKPAQFPHQITVDCAVANPVPVTPINPWAIGAGGLAIVALGTTRLRRRWPATD